MQGWMRAAGLWLVCVSVAWAQETLPRSAPNLSLVSGGQVLQLVRQADGGVIVAGSFSRFNGVPRQGLARLRPDGTLDLAFDARVGGSVDHVALAPDGGIVIAGQFGSAGGRPRLRVARLLPDGSVDANWNPALPDPSRLEALAVGDDGAVYAGGVVVVGGTTQRLVRLLPGSGAIDTAWLAALPAPNDFVFDLAIDGDALYLGGRFTQMGASPRARLAKVSAATAALDAQWVPAASDQVHDLDLDAAGRVYVVGYFGRLAGVDRDGAARVDAQGNLDLAWHPGSDGFFSHVGVLDDGSVLLGGRFRNAGGSPRHNAVRVSATDGAALPNVDVAFTEFTGVLASAQLGQARTLLVGGNFTDAGPAQHLGLVEFDANGATGLRLDAGSEAVVDALASQPDGALIVGGRFLSVDGHAQRYLLRVLPDGRFDEAWRPRLDGGVDAIAVDARGDVYLGGGVVQVDGIDTPRLAKLDGASGQRLPWAPAPNGNVWALRLDADGNLYAAGDFTTMGGVPRGRGARFTPALELTAWDPDFPVLVRDIAVGDRHVHLGGDGALSRHAVDSGARDAAWNPAPDAAVQALEVDAAGRVYVAGLFAQIGGAPRRGFARLDAATGAADPAWAPASTQYAIGYALATDAQGALYAGGGFSEMGGQVRYNVAKLAMETGAVVENWRPSTDSALLALHAMPNGDVAIGGFFRTASGQPRDALAVIPAAPRERSAQQIEFTTPAPGPYVFGGDAGAVSAQADSGLAVRYGSLTPTLCSIDADDGDIAILGAGTCLASADQDGDDTWLPAPQATQAITIDKAAQAPLSVAATPTNPETGELVSLSTTGGSGIGATSYAVTAGAAHCEIIPPATLRALAAGSCAVTATRAGDHDHLPAAASAQILVRAPRPGRVFGDGFE